MLTRCSLARNGISCMAFLSTLALFLLTLGGCFYHASGSVSIRFQALTVATQGSPIQNAGVWLRDVRFGPSDRPESLRKPLCVTDSEGTCSASVSYNVEFTSLPFLDRLRARFGDDRFILVGVQTTGAHPVWGPLPRLSRAQIGGYEAVTCNLVLSPGTSSSSSEEELLVECEAASVRG